MRLRAPVPEDAPEVLAVLVARDIADLGAPDYKLEDLRDEWRASEFDLSADAQVVELSGGQIVGYAAIRAPGTLAVVAPQFEGRGIGARVLQWAERRERELGRERHRQWIAAKNRRARELLCAAGYSHERSYWRMVCSLPRGTRVATMPVGCELRALDVGRDAEALHALDAASFAANPDYQPESFAAFCGEHLNAHDLDRELSCVATYDEMIAGFLLARRWREDGVGYVDLLAVHPEWQRRGLGSSLLEAAFDRFTSAGLREAQLGVASDNPRALRLYERVGMSPRFRADTYQRPVR
jgi:mycothiol synthase